MQFQAEGLRLHGKPGATLYLTASEDLKTWSFLKQVVLSGESEDYLDVAPSAIRQRFYRVEMYP